MSNFCPSLNNYRDPMDDPMRTLLTLSLPLVGLLALAGCQKSEPGIPSDMSREYREQLLTTDAPVDGRSVAEVRAAIASSADPAANQPVVIVGTIGKMPNPFQQSNQYPEFPWVVDSAGFFLVDGQTVAEFAKHGHAKGEECTYCLDLASRRSDRVAMVEIRQPDGQPVPYRADQLLGLQEGDQVIVTGDASLIMETMLVVVPKSIYVGPAPSASEPATDEQPATAESE